MALSMITDGMISIYKMATGLSLLLFNETRWFTAAKSSTIACGPLNTGLINIYVKCTLLRWRREGNK